MLTADEFEVGWNILTAMPWGHYYITDEARKNRRAWTMREQMYERVRYFSAETWKKACEAHCMLDHWPAMQDIVQTCRNLEPPKKPEPARAKDFSEPPEPLALAMQYMRDRGEQSLIRAVQATFPKWIKENPHHEDYIEACNLLKKFEGAKPVRGSSFGQAFKRI